MIVAQKLKIFAQTKILDVFWTSYVRSIYVLCPGNSHLFLTLSWRRPLSYKNQSTDLLRKSMD